MAPTLGAVLDLTERVQEAIDAGDWQRAQELETERRRELEQLALTPAPAGDLAATLERLAERNQRLIGHVEHHKRRVLREAATVRTGHAGAAAYTDIP